MNKLLGLVLVLLFSQNSFSKAMVSKSKPSLDFSTNKAKAIKADFIKDYSRKELTKNQLGALKQKTLDYGPAAVPALIHVMKNKDFPDRNKWMATFLLGKIVGKKSAPFISRFIQHPNWVMRMASLKTLNALQANSYDGMYAYALKDKSMIVRGQALENIRSMNLTNMAPAVWAMLYDKKNYHIPKKKAGKAKRTNLIKKVIKTVGDLKFEKAKGPLLTMAQKKKYKDIFDEIDYALSKITGKKSPSGKEHIKREFWKRMRMQETII